MTLTFHFKDIRGLKSEPNGQLQLFVKATGAPEYLSELISPAHPQFESPFIYNCSLDGQINFQVYQDTKPQPTLQSKASIPLMMIVKRGKLQQFKFTPYSIELEDPEPCTLLASVYYDPVKKFMGEMQAYHKVYEAEKTTRSGDETVRLNKHKPFYRGPCQTKNLFSVLDKRVQGQKFRLIEKNYFEQEEELEEPELKTEPK